VGKAGQIRIIPATFEEKNVRFEPIIKNKFVFFETLKQLIIQVPPTWTSTGSPQPSAQISAPHFNKCRIFPHSCKINYIYYWAMEIMMPGFLKVSC
jgi:hypothetical protein